jgi:DHA1 family bicyclomycin/chloramphenicol resistance-like MFS transporter
MRIQNSTKHTRLIMGLIIVLSILGPFAADICIPSFPVMSHSLHTSHAWIKFSLSLYFFVFALGQLFFGPLSDKLGRKRVIYYGLVLCLIGSVICALSTTLNMLLVGRAIQALGVSGGSAASRSILRDTFKGTELATIASYLGMAISIAPALAPLLGAYFQLHYGWHSGFLFVFAYTFFLLFFIKIMLPETNQHYNPKALQFSTFFNNYLQLLKDPIYLSFVSSTMIVFGSIIGYITISTFLLQTELHLSLLAYGWTTTSIIGGMFIIRFISTRLLPYFSIRKLILLYSAIITGMSLIMLSLSFFFFNLWVILLPVIIILGLMSGVGPCCMAGALTPYKKKAGAAAALLGSFQVAGAAIAGLIVTQIHSHTQLPLALFLCALAVSLLIINLIGLRLESKPTQ